MAGSADVRAGKAYVEISADQSKLEAHLRKAEARMKAFGAAASGVGEKFLAIGATFAAPFAIATRAFTSMGDVLAKASTRTGVGIEALSGLQYAATQSGTSFETLEGGLRHMAKTITEAASGSKEAKDKLSDLGLSVEGLATLSPDEQFKAIAEQVSKIVDPTQRAAAAMEIFGKSGAELIPLMEGGAAGINDLMSAAAKLGLTMSTTDAKAAEEFGDRLDDLGKVIKMNVFHIGAALQPMLESAAKAFTEAAVGVSEWVKTHRDLIASYARVISSGALWVAGIGAGVLVLGKLSTAVASIIGGFRGMITAAQYAGSAMAFLAANPVLLGITAIAAAAVTLSMAMGSAAVEAAKLGDEMQGLVEKGDRARQVDELRMQRLEQLSEAGKLSDAQMTEAQGIIDKLTDKYGDLGTSIDKVTGRLIIAAGAQEKLTEGMKKAGELQLDASIKEQENNLAALSAEQDAVAAKNAEFTDSIADNLHIPFISSSPPDLDRAKKLSQQIDVAKMRLESDRLRRGELSGENPRAAALGPVDEAERLRGKLGTPLASEQIAARKRSEEAAKEAIELAKQLAAVNEQIAMKERTAVENEVAEEHKFAAEKLALLDKLAEAEKLRIGGGRAAELEKYAADRIATEETVAARVLAIYDEAAEEQQKKEDEGFKQRLQHIEEEQRAAKQAHRQQEQREDYLLELKEQQAEAGGDAAGAAAIRAQRYRKEQADRIDDLGLEGQDKLDAQSAVDSIAGGMSQVKPTTSVAGTFNSSALSGLGGGNAAEQTAKNTAGMKKLQEKMLDEMRSNGGLSWG